VITLDFMLHQGSFTLELRERLDGGITALFGPSGSGKTTTLDAIAGLRRPASGRIALDEHVVFDASRAIDLPPHLRRGIRRFSPI
jgi:molybdate transport system ATP-binding protein